MCPATDKLPDVHQNGDGHLVSRIRRDSLQHVNNGFNSKNYGMCLPAASVLVAPPLPPKVPSPGFCHAQYSMRSQRPSTPWHLKLKTWRRVSMFIGRTLRQRHDLSRLQSTVCDFGSFIYEQNRCLLHLVRIISCLSISMHMGALECNPSC
ncbi:hypothetical protein LIA77_05457 [Sarocladium implicatum]|nr:hypothetical protein LIA77_05457 [Sarocladium implicatum]